MSEQTAAYPSDRTPIRTFSTSENVILRVYDSGPIGAKTVVLVNAFAAITHMWSTVTANLVGKGCRVVAWEARGLTEAEDGPDISIDCSFDAQVADLISVIEYTGEREVDVVGWCTGTLIGLKAAHDLPERVRRIVTIAGCFNLLPNNAYQSGHNDLMHRASRSSQHAALYLKFLRTSAARRTAEGVSVPLDDGGMGIDVQPFIELPMRSVGNFFNYSRLISSYARHQSRAWLGNVSQPVLVIIGEADTMADPAENAEAANMLQSSLLLILQGRDHFLHFRDPEVPALIGKYLLCDGVPSLAKDWFNSEATY